MIEIGPILSITIMTVLAIVFAIIVVIYVFWAAAND